MEQGEKMDRLLGEENIVQCDQVDDQINPLLTQDESSRNEVSALASLLDEMYLDQRKEEEIVVEGKGNSVDEQFELLRERLDTLEERHKQSVDSILNREDAVRALIDRVAEDVKQYVDDKLKHLDETLVACLQRRDKKWEELKKNFQKSHVSWTPVDSSTPTIMGGRAGGSGFMSQAAPVKPPIHMDFPQFGDSSVPQFPQFGH